MIKLPNKGIWTQNNLSDKFGDLWSSRNVDLVSSLGNLRISPRMILNKNSTTDADMGIPFAIKSFETTGTVKQWWMLAGENVFNSAAGLNGTIPKWTSSPTMNGYLDPDYSDLELFNGELYIFGTSVNINYIQADLTANSISSALTTGGGFHGATAFRLENRIYFVDDSGKSVGSIGTAHTAATLGNQYTINDLVDGNEIVISWIRSTSNRVWIGTINFNGSGAYIYAWDGDTANTWNESYRLESAGSYACLIKDDVPWIIDAEGKLMAFNGGTFVEKARFPIDHSLGKYLPYTYKGTQRPVHYNGMCLNDGRINILFNSAPYDTGFPNSASLERCPSGIWEYEENIGLYHKNSLGNSTSAGTINDFGQQKLKYVGALEFIKLPRLALTAGSINGSYVVGAEYYTTATTSLKGLWYDDFANTLQKAGTFVTSKIFSPNVSESWTDLAIRFEKFKNASNKIVVKYRTEESDPVDATITWTNDGNIFSTTQTGISVEDEVEFIQGVGSGYCAHITSIEDAGGGSYNITVDQTVSGTSAGTTAKARFQKWIKIKTITDDELPFDKTGLKIQTPWIQFKFWVVNQGKDEIHDLILSNTKHI